MGRKVADKGVSGRDDDEDVGREVDSSGETVGREGDDEHEGVGIGGCH